MPFIVENNIKKAETQPVNNADMKGKLEEIL